MMLRYIRLLVIAVSVLSITFIIYLSALLMNIFNEKQNTKLLQNPLIQNVVKTADGNSKSTEPQIPQERAITHPNLRSEHSSPEWRTNEDSLSVSYEVHAFYYPWYASQQFNGQWSHWNHKTIPHWVNEINNRYPPKQHQPPDDVAAKFYPSLGPYASNDPSVIRDHMRQLAYAGVGTIAVSWYPPNTKDDNAILFVDDFIPLILDIANEFEEKVCFHLEPYKDRSAKSVRDDLKYLITKYGDHPAFYRYGGKPLVYIYDSYIVPSSEWRELLSPQGSITIRNTEWDVIALGLFVSATDCSNLVNGFFDGFYTYFASRDFVFGSSPSNWRVLKDCARKLSHPELFVPSVGPGYDDTVVRPWNFRNTKHRDGGKYYQKMWEEALATDPTIVSVTSFNEWHEGTQIESAVKKQGYEDYGNDPDFYLKLTRKMVKKMKRLL